MDNPEITEYDLEQGAIIHAVFKKNMPDVAAQMEFMVKSIGWAATHALLNKYRQGIPDKVWELQITALKFLHHKYKTEAIKQ